MKKMFLSMNAIAVSAALLLTGCSQASIDMEKLQRITDNCNQIAENVSQINTEELNESIQETTETVNEVAKWVEVDVVEEIMNDTEEESEEEYDDDIFADDVDIFDILDEEAVAEIVMEPVMAQVDAITADAELILEQANELKNEGLELIMEGLELLKELSDETEISDEVLDDAIEGLSLLVEGSNKISEAANLIIQGSARTANDIVAQAELLGIEGEELDLLKATLEKAQEIQIYAFSDDVIDQLEEAKDMISEYSSVLQGGEDIDINLEVVVDFNQIEAQLEAIPGYVEEVKKLIGSANEAAVYSQSLYKEIEAGSQIVVDKARELLDGENLEIAENAIKSYELVGEYLEAIPTNKVTDIEKILDQIIKSSQNIDYQAIINSFFK